jgi:ribosomal protein S1
MKKLLLGLLAIGSISSHGSTLCDSLTSDIEKFNKKSINATEMIQSLHKVGTRICLTYQLEGMIYQLEANYTKERLKNKLLSINEDVECTLQKMDSIYKDFQTSGYNCRFAHREHHLSCS